MQKILFVNSSLTDGGSERVMVILANEFASQGYDVTMILVREKKEETYKLNPKIKCVRFTYGTKNKLLIALKRLKYLRNFIKNARFDNIISFMYDINIITLLSTIGLDIPVIVSERANPNTRKNNSLYKWLEYKTYLKAHKIVFQTDEVKAMYPISLQDKAVVIPNPVNENLPDCFEGKRKKNIVSVGRIVEQKNFSMLIEAFAKFHKIYSEYKLIIYGEGPLLENLKQEVESLGITDYVIFPGYIKNVDEEIKDAAIYVSSSNYEGISNSMIEALAMGIPSVCTDCPVGGAKLMIENGKNGILIPVGDVEALYNSMVELVENKDLSDYISKNAVNVRIEYSVGRIMEKWKSILR